MTFLGAMLYPGYGGRKVFKAGFGAKLGGRWGGWPGGGLAKKNITFYHLLRCYSPRFIVFDDVEKIEGFG